MTREPKSIRSAGAVAFLLLSTTVAAFGQLAFPPPEFSQPYQYPQTILPLPRPEIFSYIDITVLVIALSLAAWLALRSRSRRRLAILAVFSVLYFGFFRSGCICAIGAIQNVTLAIFDSGYTLPLVAAAFFVLPLLFTLFFGRVFCAAVCPLGAVQELVLLRPVKVPQWLDAPLRTVPYFYLGAAVLFAATNSTFLICRHDPFVLFFRLSGGTLALIIGLCVLALATVVGRPYCRYMCPLAALFRLLAPFAKWRLSISSGECVNCHLCADACPHGAIKPPTGGEGERRQVGRRMLSILLAALPVLIITFGWLGRQTSTMLARMNPTVSLARRVWLEEQGLVEGETDASEAFYELGTPSEELYRRAAAIQSEFDTGSWILGGWVGLVIGFHLIGLSVRRRRDTYEADASTCVECGRCFASCPVGRVGPEEIARLKAEAEQLPEELQ